MSEIVEINGTEYELGESPSLKTVRKVQSMQMGIIMDHVSEEKLMEMDSLEDESEIVQAIIEDGGYDAFQDVMFERSMLESVQTISLACDEPFNSNDFDDLGALDFKDIVSKSEEVLGGSASDFFKDSGFGMSFNEDGMREKAQEIAET